MTASPKMDDDEGWALGSGGDADVLVYINKTPLLLSLLYDLNLLPEQHPDHESEPWERIFTITNHWRENELSALESRSEVLEQAYNALNKFDDDVDMEDYESVAGWWTKRGGPALNAIRALKSPRAEPGAPTHRTLVSQALGLRCPQHGGYGFVSDCGVCQAKHEPDHTGSKPERATVDAEVGIGSSAEGATTSPSTDHLRNEQGEFHQLIELASAAPEPAAPQVQGEGGDCRPMPDPGALTGTLPSESPVTAAASDVKEWAKRVCDSTNLSWEYLAIQVSELLSSSHARGREEGLEEAAKVCEQLWKNSPNDRASGFHQSLVSHGCVACVNSIRSKIKPARGS